MNEKIAENQSIPAVPIRAATEPAQARPNIMMPLMYASTSKALTPVSLSRDSMRCVVPSSVAADNSMQKPTKRKSGVSRAMSASRWLTPISTRSVTGNSWPKNR